MTKAIDIHDMNTGIHSLYEIKSKPQTVAKAFRRLAEIDYFENHFEMLDLWKLIEENTVEIGEYNIHTQMNGRLWWTNKKLHSGVTVNHKNVTYQILESVQLY